MVWNFIVQLAIALVVSYYMRPDPPPAPNPATLEEFDVPTAEEGRPIPVVFGRVHIRSPNVVWYGDLRTTPIKSGGGGK
jgi:hypothetical protein